MRHSRLYSLPLALALGVAAIPVTSCVSDNDDDTYAEWRTANEEWLTQMEARRNADGTPYYTRVSPDWNPDAYVLIHYFNDRRETEGNLTPLYTSTVDVRYQLHTYNDVRVDSSLSNMTYGDGVARFRINSRITGWIIAFEDIRVGDTCEVVVPYQWAYGTSVTSTMPPYSNLRFNLRLTDIPYYEVRD